MEHIERPRPLPRRELPIVTIVELQSFPLCSAQIGYRAAVTGEASEPWPGTARPNTSLA